MALPILFVMLLLIFGSPIAALIPAISGLIVTRTGIAVLGLTAERVDIDALALNLVTMVGLALGVDYALLVVSRFREELAEGASVAAAAEEAAVRAGRTVLLAGGALTAGMACGMLVAPGALLVSSGLGVIVAALLAVAVATLAMPAALAVLGTNVNRWPLRRPHGSGDWQRRSERILRKPGVAALFVLLPLTLLAAPALALKSGPPNVANLPKDNAARKSYEAFERSRGAGWSTPYEVVFHTKGPVTTTQRLRALGRFQSRVAKLDGVEAVLGPAALLDRTAVLRKITRDVTSGQKQVKQLEHGLTRTRNGTGKLRNGLAAGATGAGQLAAGLGQAAAGSQQLAQGTSQAAPQTRRLADGVRQTQDGAKRLTGGLGQARDGTGKLESNLNVLRDSLVDANSTADSKLNNPAAATQSAVQAALRDLGSITDPTVAGNPSVKRAKDDLQRALTQLGPLKTNLANYTTDLSANATASKELARGVARLSDALVQLASGSGKLDNGIGQTAAGAAALAAGVDQLSASTGALSGGLATLLNGPNGNDGAKELARQLGRATSGSNSIGRALERMLASVVRVRSTNDSRQAELRRNGTDLNRAADSGYFVLAAIEGAKPQAQTNVAFATNAASGGNTARVIVVPHRGPFAKQSASLRPRPAARGRSHGARDAGDHRDRRAGGRARRLRPGDERPLRPAHPRALAGDVPRPAGGVPRAAARAARGGAEPRDRRRRRRRARALLPGRRPAARRCGGARRDRADGDLRDRLRAVDRLRGLLHEPARGGPRADRDDRRRDRLRAAQDGRDHHRRRVHHGRGVPRVRRRRR